MPYGISNKALEKFLKAVLWDEVVKKAEHAEKGTRLWPTNKSKEADRLERGSDLGDRKSEVILQPNIDAKDQSVKKAA
jgi:hypothetical protein